MTETNMVIFILLVLFLTTFVRSTLGFGDALIGMPLITWIAGIRVATPLLALAASVIAALILLRSRRQVRLGDAWRLILATLLGIPLGLWALNDLPEALVKSILGVLIALFGLYHLLKPQLPELRGDGWAWPFGFFAGILGGAYNTNGPPVVVYGVMRRFPAENFRATLQAYFFLTNWLILAGHAAAGLWTGEVLRLFAFSLPVLGLGVAAGEIANRRIADKGRFNQVVYAALVVMGVLLVV